MTVYRVDRDPGGDVVPIARLGNGTPISNTCGVGATTAESLGGSLVFRVTADNNVYLKFGTGSVSATADADDSLLFLAGTEIMIIPEGATHWSGIRAGGTDAVVQFFPVND